MPGTIMIRETTPIDLPQLLALYPVIFPDEELRPVVKELIESEAEILSLAVFEGDAPVAHLLFTLFGEEKGNGTGALLGPLGVLPGHQGKGVGTLLVRHGLERLKEMGIVQIFVLGDPAFYGRFGFVPERHVQTPCPIPEEWRDAWQSLAIAEGSPLSPGKMRLPEPWLDPALWA